MKFIQLAVVPTLIALTLGCTVSDDKLLSDIDAGLWTKICDKATADGEDTVFECDGADPLTVPATTSAECQTSGNAASAGDCTATFADWKRCVEFDLDQCDLENSGPAKAMACEAFSACTAAQN